MDNLELVVVEDADKLKKLKKKWLRKQVDFKVLVREGRKDGWHDFTGLFLMSEGWDKNKVTRYIKESFSTKQFRRYTFGLFERRYNPRKRSFSFYYESTIRLLPEKKSLDLE